MAVKVHGRKANVYIQGNDLSDVFTNADTQQQIDAAEVTAFTSQDKEFIAGQRGGNARFQGWYSKTALSSDPVLAALADDPDTEVVLTIIRDTDVFEGPAEALKGPIASYGRTSPIAGVVAVSAEFVASGGLNTCRTLKAKGSLTPSVAGGTTSAYNGGTATTLGATGYLQVFGITGSPVVEIQDSPNGTADWTALITFAVAVANSAQKVAATGNVDPYLRTVVTGGTAVCWVGVHQPIF